LIRVGCRHQLTRSQPLLALLLDRVDLHVHLGKVFVRLVRILHRVLHLWKRSAGGVWDSVIGRVFVVV
jgi:hypothetical protein